jgi:hypothetical protein
MVNYQITTLNWGEGVTKFVLSMCINFAIMAAMVSRVMFKIMEIWVYAFTHTDLFCLQIVSNLNV